MLTIFNNGRCYITHFKEKSQTGVLEYKVAYYRKTATGKFYPLAVLVTYDLSWNKSAWTQWRRHVGKPESDKRQIYNNDSIIPISYYVQYFLGRKKKNQVTNILASVVT